MPTMLLRFTAVLPVVLAALGCTTEETDPAAEFRTSTLACGGCPPNSPRANDYYVPDLHIDGEANDDDVMLVGVRDELDNLLELGIHQDELFARNPQTNVITSGYGLIGHRIEVTRGLGDIQHIHILGFGNVDSWADSVKPMSVYALAYEDPGTRRLHNVCPEFLSSPDLAVVTALGEERYDEATKSVVPDQEGWITLACEGQAVYKMKRLGYSPHIKFNGPSPSTPAQRDATLKMITASYCASTNDYTSYTYQGTPILWANAAGSVNETMSGMTLEAVWNENGAVCWNQHRTDLVPGCAPVPCTANHVGEWTTWLPPLPPDPCEQFPEECPPDP